MTTEYRKKFMQAIAGIRRPLRCSQVHWHLQTAQPVQLRQRRSQHHRRNSKPRPAGITSKLHSSRLLKSLPARLPRKQG